MIDFRTQPADYRHWRLAIDGAIATLALDVDEGGAIAGDYTLKLNSYDLGVDIELADAVQRLRFEHPHVRAVVLTSGKDRVFCAGANIAMLATSSHIDKVNFCKFTNETRNAIEDASANSGQRWMTVVAGTAAGGGYELALATDHILLVDDGSTAVSLPEVPLLAVLPGTGGLTRVVDKRCVRRDRADFFCTTGRRRARASGAGVEPGRRAGAALPLRGCRGRPRRRPRRGLGPARRRGGNRAARPSPAALTDDGARLCPRARRARPGAGHGDAHGLRARHAAALPMPPRSVRPAQTSGRWRSRASWTTRSCTCASTSRRSAPGS